MTASQGGGREGMKAAAQAWKALDPARKQAYKAAARKMNIESGFIKEI